MEYLTFFGQMVQHLRMHSGSKPHICPFCAYRSCRRDNLRSHIRRMHGKENIYIDSFMAHTNILLDYLWEKVEEMHAQDRLEEFINSTFVPDDIGRIPLPDNIGNIQLPDDNQNNCDDEDDDEEDEEDFEPQPGPSGYNPRTGLVEMVNHQEACPSNIQGAAAHAMEPPRGFSLMGPEYNGNIETADNDIIMNHHYYGGEINPSHQFHGWSPLENSSIMVASNLVGHGLAAASSNDGQEEDDDPLRIPESFVYASGL